MGDLAETIALILPEEDKNIDFLPLIDLVQNDFFELKKKYKWGSNPFYYLSGKNEIHRRLQIDEFTEQPRMVFFNTCTETISQLPAIPLDKRNPEDVDTRAEDHIYDALRYGIMSRPRFSIFDYEPMGRPTSSMPVADSTFGY